MKIEAPLVPDATYVSELRALGDMLDSVHFALPGLGAFDARQHAKGDRKDILDALQDLPGVPRYLLLNGRMLPPERYLDRHAMRELAQELDTLRTEAGLVGIVVADFHLLRALGAAAPGICSKLEAVPSVNAMIDSPARLNAVLNAVKGSGFAMPSRVILDRSLNRDFTMLERTSKAARKRLPGAEIVLLANEGCLPQCPYKGAHNAHVAMVNLGLCEERTHEANREFACLKAFVNNPAMLLASPYIRPEDAAHYEGVADVLKVCGRTRGPEFLRRVVRGYVDEQWDGNLLEMLDAVGDASHLLHVENKSLPSDFLNKMTGCDQDCDRCGACTPLLERAFRRLPVRL